MRWTKQHDLILLQEILMFEPFGQKKGSPERGRVWETISESLNGHIQDNITFHTTLRSVRDRFNVLKGNYQKRQRDEEKASGISPEVTEIDILLEDILERFKEVDERQQKEHDEKKQKASEEAAQAIEMRKRSLETFKESEIRNETPKRSRNNGSDTINYLSEKFKSESEIRKQELELRKQEMNQQKDFLAAILHSQQQQQTAMFSLLERVVDSKQK